MPLLADRVRETSATTGTGTLTLAGAVAGYQGFNAAFANADTVYYVIHYATEWEVGIGTVGTGTLSRDSVLSSSNANALVAFSAGTKDVFCAYVAGRAVTTSDAATLTNKTIDDYTNNIGANSTHFRVKASGTIGKGAVIKATGFTPGEQAIEVALVASASDTAIGVMEQALTAGQFGMAVVIGELFNVNTSAFAFNDVLYSNGVGAFTATKPSGGTFQTLGTVVRSNANNGVIAVNIVAPLFVEASTNTANTLVLRDASGNFAAGTITAGAVTSTGLVTVASLKGTGATTVTNILDEDNMASNSATALATQQSIKAYVDAQVATVDTLAEVLANGNTTGANDISVNAGQKIRTPAVAAQDGTASISIANSTGAVTLSVGLADSNLATISTGGKVSNSATTATSANTASAIVARDGSGNFTAGTVTAALTGNASTATALATARNINGVAFDGTADITVTAAAGTLSGATLAAGVTASSLTSVGTLGNLTVTNPITGSVTGSSGSSTGNAATATALQTARAINGVNFDGTAAITVTAAAGTVTGATLASNVLASSLTSVGTLAGLTVTAPITGSVTGSSGSTTGNAATATTLATARNINGVSFNGSADITVTAAAGTLSGATLASGVTASSLTSVGTLGSLTVSGDTIVGAEVFRGSDNSYIRLAGGNPSATGANVIVFGSTHASAPGRVSVNAVGTGIIEFSAGGAQRAIIDASGNLGLGVTPSAWLGVYRTMQLGAAASLSGRSDETSWLELLGNAYRDTNADWRYINTNLATSYRMAVGTHSWYTAPSGTAGNAISFVQAMTLDASSRLAIGTTLSSTQAQLEVAFDQNLSTLGQSRRFILNDLRGGVNERTEIGFGYVSSTMQPVVIGYQTTDSSVNTKGILYFATRDVTTNTAPTERARITAGGDFNCANKIRAGALTGNAAALRYEVASPALNASATLAANINYARIQVYESTNTSSGADFFLAAGVLTKVTDPDNVFSVVAGTAGKINVTFASGTLTVENKRGANDDYRAVITQFG